MYIHSDTSAGVEALLGGQDILENTRYRKFSYCIVTECGEKTIACNTLTRRIVEITEEEKEILSNGISSSDMGEAAKKLVKKWFLVPENHDDYEFCNETRELMALLRKGDGKYGKYIIMTTLDCNARCFYCYQMGRKNTRAHMTAETALDVAKFIERTARGRIQILWYGGEPLYNDSVIDIICNYLHEHNVEFASTMISNAYLLTDEIVERASKNWNLGKIQITLDGPEEVYNKCKAFIYKEDPSPYRTVIANVERALKAGWYVNIRVNMDNHNVKQIYELADELFDKFGQYEKFKIYAAGLYENSGPNKPQRTDESRMQLTDDLIEFSKYCRSRTLRLPGTFKGIMKTSRCLADSEFSVTISPEGNLGKCDHVMGTDIFGSIYSDKVDHQMLSVWRERLNNKEDCGDCPIYPDCIRLKKCPDDGGERCTPAYRKLHTYQMEEKIKNTYLGEKNKAE